jgi:hypothetical protein
VTPEEVLAELAAFRAQCEGAEYTDTGEAWRIIELLEDALIAEVKASVQP